MVTGPCMGEEVESDRARLADDTELRMDGERGWNVIVSDRADVEPIEPFERCVEPTGLGCPGIYPATVDICEV